MQLEILLNTKVFKYKYIGKYFKYFSFSGYITIIGKRKANNIWQHLVCRCN